MTKTRFCTILTCALILFTKYTNTQFYKHIDLSGGQLKDTTLQKEDLLKDATSLNLSKNNLFKLPKIEYPPSLTELYLTDNYLTGLKDMPQLNKLRLLHLGNNVLPEIDLTFRLPELRILFIPKNQIAELRELTKLEYMTPNLQSINLEGNPILKNKRESSKLKKWLRKRHISLLRQNKPPKK
ncbi:MAG TPA: hypothetical protein QGF02_00505 [Candidatus Babeliales bacterium]|nr:hypothetical protein [Candidatus Babeliales bacterium]